MCLIETQSKATLGAWALSYAEAHFLTIYEKSYSDGRPRATLEAARAFFSGELKLNEARKLFDSHAAANAAEGNCAAQAAARAIAHAAAITHTVSHTLGTVVYGTTAIVCDIAGTGETFETYERLTAAECVKMESALKAMAVADEKNPVKIDWTAMTSEGSLLRKSYYFGNKI